MIYVTPEILAGLYDVLRMTRPFRGWKLPPSDEVGFHVSASDSPQGEYWFEKGQHHLKVSAKKHHTLRSTMETLAHEMIHLHEQQIGVRGDVQHGWQFKRFAASVCRHHNFDLGQF
jgi:hypothetical protein